jgi:hypothetical protein
MSTKINENIAKNKKNQLIIEQIPGDDYFQDEKAKQTASKQTFDFLVGVPGDIKGIYDEAVGYVTDLLNKYGPGNRTIKLPKFDLILPPGKSRSENLFYKIMFPSVMQQLTRSGSIRSGLLPTFKMDPEFLRIYDYFLNKEIKFYGGRHDPYRSLAYDFKKELKLKGFEEKLFAPENVFKRRLHHSNKNKEQILYSIFFDPNETKILTLDNFEAHFRREKGPNIDFLTQVLKVRKNASAKHEELQPLVDLSIMILQIAAAIMIDRGYTAVTTKALGFVQSFLLEEAALVGLGFKDYSLFASLYEDYGKFNKTLKNIVHFDLKKKISEFEKKCTSKSSEECASLLKEINSAKIKADDVIEGHFEKINLKFETKSKSAERIIMPRRKKTKPSNFLYLNPGNDFQINHNNKKIKELKSFVTQIEELINNSNTLLQGVTFDSEDKSAQAKEDFKELMNMSKTILKTYGSSMTDSVPGKINESMLAVQSAEQKLTNSKINMVKEASFLRATWADFYLKTFQSKAMEHSSSNIKLLRSTANKMLVRMFFPKLVQKKGAPAAELAVKTTQETLNMFFDKFVEQVYFDDTFDGQRAINAVTEGGEGTSPPQIFVKLKGANSILAFYAVELPIPGGKSTKSLRLSLIKHAFDAIINQHSTTLGPISAGDMEKKMADVVKSLEAANSLDQIANGFISAVGKIYKAIDTKKNTINAAYKNYLDVDGTEGFGADELNKTKYFYNKLSEILQKLYSEKQNLSNFAAYLAAFECAVNQGTGKASRTSKPAGSRPFEDKLLEQFSRKSLAALINETVFQEGSLLIEPELIICEQAPNPDPDKKTHSTQALQDLSGLGIGDIPGPNGVTKAPDKDKGKGKTPKKRRRPRKPTSKVVKKKLIPAVNSIAEERKKKLVKFKIEADVGNEAGERIEIHLIFAGDKEVFINKRNRSIAIPGFPKFSSYPGALRWLGTEGFNAQIASGTLYAEYGKLQTLSSRLKKAEEEYLKPRP